MTLLTSVLTKETKKAGDCLLFPIVEMHGKPTSHFFFFLLVLAFNLLLAVGF